MSDLPTLTVLPRHEALSALMKLNVARDHLMGIGIVCKGLDKLLPAGELHAAHAHFCEELAELTKSFERLMAVAEPLRISAHLG